MKIKIRVEERLQYFWTDVLVIRFSVTQLVIPEAEFFQILGFNLSRKASIY